MMMPVILSATYALSPHISLVVHPSYLFHHPVCEKVGLNGSKASKTAT